MSFENDPSMPARLMVRWLFYLSLSTIERLLRLADRRDFPTAGCTANSLHGTLNQIRSKLHGERDCWLRHVDNATLSNLPGEFFEPATDKQRGALYYCGFAWDQTISFSKHQAHLLLDEYMGRPMPYQRYVLSELGGLTDEEISRMTKSEAGVMVQEIRGRACGDGPAEDAESNT